MTEILNDVTVDLNEREKVILKELRYLYDERHGLLVFPLNAIAYRLIGRLLRDSIEEEHFVIAKEGLEIKTEKV